MSAAEKLPARIAIVPASEATELVAALRERLTAAVEPLATEVAGQPVGGDGSDAARQLARALIGLEGAATAAHPDAAVLLGEGPETLAAALVCAKLGVPFARVGAGVERERADAGLPDRLADLLLCGDEEALERLRVEGLGERARIAASADQCAAAIREWLGS